jgi:hypothetical protein
VLTQAAEVYMAQHGVNELPPSGVGIDRFEVMLVCWPSRRRSMTCRLTARWSAPANPALSLDPPTWVR